MTPEIPFDLPANGTCSLARWEIGREQWHGTVIERGSACSGYPCPGQDYPLLRAGWRSAGGAAECLGIPAILAARCRSASIRSPCSHLGTLSRTTQSADDRG